MKESLQDQLARLTRSGELQPSMSGRGHQQGTVSVTVASAPILQKSAKSNEDALTPEVERLRKANEQLKAELDALKENSSAEIGQLQGQYTDVLERWKAAEMANAVLANENLQIRHELADLPSKSEILDWRAKVNDANDLILDLDIFKNELENRQRQLEEDRANFETDLVRLQKLDEAFQELSVRQSEVAAAEGDLGRRSSTLEASGMELAFERDRLEKWSNELKDLQVRYGHLKGVEKALQSLKDEHAKLSRLYEGSKTRIRNLSAEKNDARQNQIEADSAAKKLTKELNFARKRLDAVPEGEMVIRSFETVEWLVSQFDDPYEAIVPKQILLIGEGPWSIDSFSSLLLELGFDVRQNGYEAETEIVIVGRDNWSKSVIDAQIEHRDGEPLRIYPQELFVMLLAMQADPLEIAEPEALLKFVDQHPVFDYLFSQEFPWPETEFEDGPPATIGEGFSVEDASSPLYKMGYSVAQQVSLGSARRHELLEETYAEESLPWCISDDYMADWGEANSRKRLRRIAWHLHLLIKRFKRHPEAVARWEADLAWLKNNYYRPIHRFRWPS